MIATLALVLRFALAIALYAFLGWAMLTLWQELKQQGKIISSQKKPGVTVIVKTEQGRESQIFFSQTEVVIGRDTNCDISMIDEALSAQHARIAFHHGQWWLEDLSSTNGTFLNREKVVTPVVLITGDEFKCGNTLFRIQVDTELQVASTRKQ